MDIKLLAKLLVVKTQAKPQRLLSQRVAMMLHRVRQKHESIHEKAVSSRPPWWPLFAVKPFRLPVAVLPFALSVAPAYRWPGA